MFQSGHSNRRLIIDGVDATKSSIFERSAHVGTVLQDPDGQFIGLTVGEDIAFSLENSCMPQDEMHQITRKVAELVKINNHLDYAPMNFPADKNNGSVSPVLWWIR